MPIYPVIISSSAMSSEGLGVKRFLDDINLGAYWEIFKAKGYDRETDILYLDEADMEVMDIDKDHRPIILSAASHYDLSQEFRVQMWLEENGLGYYFENFRLNDYTDMKTVEHLELNEDIFHDLEMTVPGHKKKLQRAIKNLRKRQRTEQVEEPLARGYWGKPPPLHEARNDFLCLQAEIASKEQAEKKMTLDFMVDSGSDVVTVRDEVLQYLGLSQFATAQSHGIHATKEKPLYQALIRIGSSEVETEVVADTYDSIGNQVLRNFRHYIDGRRHFWLRGDMKVPPPSVIEMQQLPSLSPASSQPGAPSNTEGDTPALPANSQATSSGSSVPTEIVLPSSFTALSSSDASTSGTVTPSKDSSGK